MPKEDKVLYEMKPDDIVKSFEYIDWLDHASFSHSSWRPLEDTKADLTPYAISSVGWLLKETDKYILISPHVSFENGSESGSKCILKSDIIFRKTITHKYVYNKQKVKKNG